jgi:hypothetical protein
VIIAISGARISLYENVAKEGIMDVKVGHRPNHLDCYVNSTIKHHILQILYIQCVGLYIVDLIIEHT